MASHASAPSAPLPGRFDAALARFLAERRAELAAMHPDAPLLLDLISSLVRAGGGRLRPSFAYWGFRAAGGADGEAIITAAGSLELLHTMALIHDDLVDDADERRGVPSVHRAASVSAPRGVEPDRFGRAVALIAGDLAAVWGDQMLLASGFDVARLADALAVSHGMRQEMAAGQVLGVAAAEGDPDAIAALKGGTYTVEGPLLVGAALAGAPASVRDRLGRFGRPLGIAFQFLDDLRDGDAASGVTRDRVDALVADALAVLDEAPVIEPAIPALRALASAMVIV